MRPTMALGPHSAENFEAKCVNPIAAGNSTCSLLFLITRIFRLAVIARTKTAAIGPFCVNSSSNVART